MTDLTEKPYLTNVGVGLPLAGLWGHRYIETRRKHKLRSTRLLGLHLVIISYRRLRSVP